MLFALDSIAQRTLSSSYYAFGTLLGSWATSVNKSEIPVLMELTSNLE